jgi:hypothetical protein
MGTLHEDQHTFFYHISPNSGGIRNVSDKLWREKRNTHFMVNNIFFEIVLLMR